MKTKNWFIIIMLKSIIICGFCHGSMQDVNADQVIGLTEAIYALQVAAGIKTQSSDETGETVDLFNYYFNDGAEYFYKKTYYDENSGSNVSIYEYAHHLSKELNNRLTFIECRYGGGSYQEYYSIKDNFDYVSIGDYWNGWYNAQIKLGSEQMAPGDVFASTYQINDFPYWIQYEIAGFEDVQTQAGLFENCLKISRLYSYQWGVLFSYYATGVGLVKQVYASDSNSYTMELIGSFKAGAVYPADLTIQRYYGTWSLASAPATSDSITFYNLPQQGNISTLIFHNFPYSNQHKTISLESANGYNYTPANLQEIISVVVSGSSINGSYTYTYYDETAQENKTMELSFSGTMLSN